MADNNNDVIGPKKMITMDDMLGENNDVYINIEYLEEPKPKSKPCECVNDDKDIDMIGWIKDVVFRCCGVFQDEIL